MKAEWKKYEPDLMCLVKGSYNFVAFSQLKVDLIRTFFKYGPNDEVVIQTSVLGLLHFLPTGDACRRLVSTVLPLVCLTNSENMLWFLACLTTRAIQLRVEPDNSFRFSKTFSFKVFKVF